MKRSRNDKKLSLHIGDDFAIVAKRVADAWHRAERGEEVYENHVTFASWDAMSSIMTEKRYELLRYLRRHPEPSVAALARGIGRDYKRVHQDVEALEQAGLIERQDELRAPFGEIRATIHI